LVRFYDFARVLTLFAWILFVCRGSLRNLVHAVLIIVKIEGGGFFYWFGEK
jgi:hypothetical protein